MQITDEEYIRWEKEMAAIKIHYSIFEVIHALKAVSYTPLDVYKRQPKGMVGMMEACILAINDDVIKGCIGKDYKRYAPYLLTAFFFIPVSYTHLDVYKRQMDSCFEK